MSVKRVPSLGSKQPESPKIDDRVKSQIAGIKPSVLDRVKTTISNLGSCLQFSHNKQPSNLGKRSLEVHLDEHNRRNGTNEYFINKMGKVDLHKR